MTINTSPEFTDAPFAALICTTLPSHGAMISFSIFIASKIQRTSPFDTVSPSETLMSSTVPGIGAVTVLPPAGTGAAAFGAAGFGAGAAAGAGAAGLGAAAGRATGADGMPPTSSTSTS